MIKRVTALILVVAMVVSMAASMTSPVLAASITDYPSGVNVMIRSETPHTYLDVRNGGSTWGLSARIWSYVTADAALEGPAFCVNHVRP